MDWLDNHALAESEARTGWTYEDQVADALRAAGVDVEQPPKSWRADVADRKAYVNEVDLVAYGMRLSVKSRRVRFTSPTDVPSSRNPLFVDTVRKWAVKHPTPFAVVCVSQVTDAMIWLPVTATAGRWGTRRAHDAVRGYADDFYTADALLWQPLTTLPEALRTHHDGVWVLSTTLLKVSVTVADGRITSWNADDPTPTCLALYADNAFDHSFAKLVRILRTQPLFQACKLSSS